MAIANYCAGRDDRIAVIPCRALARKFDKTENPLLAAVAARTCQSIGGKLLRIAPVVALV
jgi:hypothetical protein